jgi:hypothetical protein
LVRNLADAVVSLRDHIRKDPSTPVAFFTADHQGMDDADLGAAVVRLAMPWYLNFYAGWRTNPSALILNYEDMITDLAGAMVRVFERAQFTAVRGQVLQALERVQGKNTRFNVGMPRRGRALAPQAAIALLDLLDSYPALQSDPLFVHTRDTLASHRRKHLDRVVDLM